MKGMMRCLQEVVDGGRYVGITEVLGRCGVLQLDLSPSVLCRQMLPAFGNPQPNTCWIKHYPSGLYKGFWRGPLACSFPSGQFICHHSVFLMRFSTCAYVLKEMFVMAFLDVNIVVCSCICSSACLCAISFVSRVYKLADKVI